jgi:hypothetical protein
MNGPDAFKSQRWGGQKVMWLARRGARQPILVRGRSLSGTASVGFGDAPEPDMEFVIAFDTKADTREWLDFPGYSRFTEPGCYVFQIDAIDGSWHVFVEVRDTANPQGIRALALRVKGRTPEKRMNAKE